MNKSFKMDLAEHPVAKEMVASEKVMLIITEEKFKFSALLHIYSGLMAQSHQRNVFEALIAEFALTTWEKWERRNFFLLLRFMENDFLL